MPDSLNNTDTNVRFIKGKKGNKNIICKDMGSGIKARSSSILHTQLSYLMNALDFIYNCNTHRLLLICITDMSIITFFNFGSTVRHVVIPWSLTTIMTEKTHNPHNCES